MTLCETRCTLKQELRLVETAKQASSDYSAEEERILEALLYEQEHGTARTCEHFAVTRAQLADWREACGVKSRTLSAEDIEQLPRRTGRISRTAEELSALANELGEMMLARKNCDQFIADNQLNSVALKVKQGVYQRLSVPLADRLAAMYRASKKTSRRTIAREAAPPPISSPPPPPAPPAPIEQPLSHSPITEEDAQSPALLSQLLLASQKLTLALLRENERLRRLLRER